jgi:hypothetical protein
MKQEVRTHLPLFQEKHGGSTSSKLHAAAIPGHGYRSEEIRMDVHAGSIAGGTT